MDLADKTAIVTAAGAIAGASVAELFARHGANVVVVDSQKQAAESVAYRIVEGGGTAIPVATDVRSKSDADAVVVETLRHFGAIDILVNTTSFQPPAAAMLYLTEAQWDQAVEAVPKRMFLCCQAVIPAMVNQNRGRIINAAPASPQLTDIGAGLLYGLLKDSIVTLTRHIAREFASNNIRANAVCPGTLEPSTTQGTGAALRQNPSTRLAGVARSCTPEDLAEVVLFVASSRSDMITGQVFYVDGGVRDRFLANERWPARKRIEKDTVQVHE